MDIFPIWKTSYYPTTESDAVFRIMKWGTQEIYRGRGRRYPEGNYLDINLNKPTQNAIDSMIYEALGESGDTVAASNAYAEFSLQFYSESNDTWTTVYQFAMVNDWSYEEHEGNVYSDPINGHACPGMVLPYSYLVTGETETVCYEEWDMNPHITLSPSAITFGYGASNWEVYVTANTEWQLKSNTGKFTISQTSGPTGTTRVVITATRNETIYEILGQIVFEVRNQYGRDTATLSIKQNGATPYFTITSGGTASFDGHPATWVITYNTNIVPAYYEMVDSNFNLIASGYTSGGTLSVQVPASMEAETYYVYFSKDDHSYHVATATATQEALPLSITVTPSRMYVFGGGSREITVFSTEEWTATPPSGITMSQTTGTSGTTVVTITFGDVSDIETITIPFTTTYGGATATADFTLRRYPEGYTGFTGDYLTFEFLTETDWYAYVDTYDHDYGVGTWDPHFSISTDSGETWSNYPMYGTGTGSTLRKGTTLHFNQGDTVMVKGTLRGGLANPPLPGDGATGSTVTTRFRSGGVNVYGDIMSLISTATTALTTFAFAELFNEVVIVDARNLLMPRLPIPSYGCMNMFGALRYAPELLSPRVGRSGYERLFNGSSIEYAPDLPATGVGMYAYSEMFANCTSLVSAGTIYAPTFMDHSYNKMFYKCSNLKQGPTVLLTSVRYQINQNLDSPAVEGCFWFVQDCEKLETISFPLLEEPQQPSGAIFYGFMTGVPATGTFTRKAGADWEIGGTSGIPTGWTIIDN